MNPWRASKESRGTVDSSRMVIVTTAQRHII